MTKREMMEETVRRMRLEDAFDNTNEDLDPLVELTSQYLELKIEFMTTYEIAEELGDEEVMEKYKKCRECFNEIGQRLIKCGKEVDRYFPAEELHILNTEDLDELIEEHKVPENIIGKCPHCGHFVRMNDVMK